jgi:hypothetical protein
MSFVPKSFPVSVLAVAGYGLFVVQLALAGTGGATAATVEARDGNVFIRDGAQQRQLTRSGKDSEPALSPDGTTVVFTRVGNPASSGDPSDCKSGA